MTGPKIPRIYWEARPKENHSENGGSSAQIFPKALHTESWREQNILLFSPPKVFGESSEEKSGLKTPIFPMVSFGLGFFTELSPRNFGQQKNCRLETLCLPSGFLRPGVAGPKIPKIYWEARPKENHSENGGSSAQIFPKALHTESWREQNILLFFPTKGLWGELWGKIWVENPHFPYGFLWLGWSGAKNSRQAKGNRRETGVFSPDFPQSSPQ